MFGDDHVWQQRSPYSNRMALSSSVLAHVIMGALAIWVANLPRTFASLESTPMPRKYDLVWMASPGPGGGGGGSGDGTQVLAPAREVGRDRLTVPTTRSEQKPVEKPKEPPATEALEIAAKPLADTAQSLPGVIDAAPIATTTQGPGTEGGAGTGAGSGSGEGRGSGLGPGFGAGSGGGAYRPGNGITGPQLLPEVKPNYTATAMRAKVQGVVLLECVVLPDGSVGEVAVLKSLDKEFGLDDEAIKAAKQWASFPVAGWASR